MNDLPKNRLGNVTPVVPSRPSSPPDPTSQLDVNISVTDLYTIGIGPSSSHTVGPMRAAKRFVEQLTVLAQMNKTDRVLVQLYGSLALTGHGHATDLAILLGLSGARPSRIDPEDISPLIAEIREYNKILLNGHHEVPFYEDNNLLFLKDEVLPEHANGMRFSAFSAEGDLLLEKSIFSGRWLCCLPGRGRSGGNTRT